MASNNSVGTSTVNNSSLADIDTGKYDDGCGLVDNRNWSNDSYSQCRLDELQRGRKWVCPAAAAGANCLGAADGWQQQDLGPNAPVNQQ